MILVQTDFSTPLTTVEWRKECAYALKRQPPQLVYRAYATEGVTTEAVTGAAIPKRWKAIVILMDDPPLASALLEASNLIQHDGFKSVAIQVGRPYNDDPEWSTYMTLKVGGV